ncbi:MAG TPA: DUF3857 domain-containing protein [bacterium]|nr:DUF3857 domain-containing protein [bacterium]
MRISSSCCHGFLHGALFLMTLGSVCLSTVSAFDILTGDTVREIIASAPAPEFRDVPAGFLSRRIHIDITSETSAVYTEEALIHILADQAKHDLGDLQILFEPEYERVDVLCAETYSVTGEVIPLMTGADNEMIPPDMLESVFAGTQKIRVLAFSDVTAGSVLHYAYTITRDFSRDGRFISDEILLETVYPIAHSEITVRYPETVPVQIDLRNACPEPHILKSEGLVSYEWIQEDVPAVTVEWGMPALGNRVPVIGVTTAQWDRLGEWFRQRFFRESLTAPYPWFHSDPDAAALLSGPDYRVVDRCYRYVSDTILWTDVSPEVRGYRPSLVSEILERKYGDALDKARLLAGMLAEAGIASDIVFYPLDGTRGRSNLPSLHGLNGLAVVVSPAAGNEIWLDMSTDSAATGWFFAGERMDGIRFSGSIARAERLPVPPAGVSVSRRDIRMQMSVDGSATGSVTWEGSGVFDGIVRWRMTELQRHDVEHYFRRRFNGAVFSMIPGVLELPDWYDYSRDLEFHIEFESDEAGQICSDMMVLICPDIPVPECRRVIPVLSAERRNPVVMGPPALEIQEVTIQLPAGYTAVYCPVDAHVAGEGFSVIQRITESPDTLTLRRQFRWTVSEFQPEQYLQLLRAYTRFTGETENVILLRKSPLD